MVDTDNITGAPMGQCRYADCLNERCRMCDKGTHAADNQRTHVHIEAVNKQARMTETHGPAGTE
jgi:hypothetical protein